MSKAPSVLARGNARGADKAAEEEAMPAGWMNGGRGGAYELVGSSSRNEREVEAASLGSAGGDGGAGDDSGHGGHGEGGARGGAGGRCGGGGDAGEGEGGGEFGGGAGDGDGSGGAGAGSSGGGARSVLIRVIQNSHD